MMERAGLTEDFFIGRTPSFPVLKLVYLLDETERVCVSKRRNFNRRDVKRRLQLLCLCEILDSLDGFNIERV